MECAVTSADIQSEDDQGGEMCEEDLQNWQSLVSHEVLASLTPQEIKRQEVINGESAARPHSVEARRAERPLTCPPVRPQSCSTPSELTCGR